MNVLGSMHTGTGTYVLYDKCSLLHLVKKGADTYINFGGGVVGSDCSACKFAPADEVD